MISDLLFESIYKNKYENRGTRIALQFSEPVPYIFEPCSTNYVDRIVVDHFFINGSNVYVTNRKNSRYGRHFTTTYIEKLISMNIVPRVNQVFEDYATFKRRFSLKYIAEEKILELWNSKKWNKRDFKSMNYKARIVMNKFDEKYKGINDLVVELSGAYRARGSENKELVETYYTRGGSGRGRDITIQHIQGMNYVHYSSNGAYRRSSGYGIIARKNVWLWLGSD